MTPITHTVVFRLQHPGGSEDERVFLAAAQELSRIPGVKDFRQWRQVSPKSDFTHAFSMRFADQATYDAYSEHPDHVAFVRDTWVPEVADFQELDFVSSS